MIIQLCPWPSVLGSSPSYLPAGASVNVTYLPLCRLPLFPSRLHPASSKTDHRPMPLHRIKISHVYHDVEGGSHFTISRHFYMCSTCHLFHGHMFYTTVVKKVALATHDAF
jgi:hypothetical protein